MASHFAEGCNAYFARLEVGFVSNFLYSTQSVFSRIWQRYRETYSPAIFRKVSTMILSNSIFILRLPSFLKWCSAKKNTLQSRCQDCINYRGYMQPVPVRIWRPTYMNIMPKMKIKMNQTFRPHERFWIIFPEAPVFNSKRT